MSPQLTTVVANAMAQRRDPILSATLPAILETIHGLKYTDEYRVHCAQGVPKLVILADGTRIRVER